MTTNFIKNLSPNANRVLNNIIWLLFDKGIKMALGLLIGIWIARYLGPEHFGKFNYGQSFIAIFAAFVNLGLDTTLVKKLVDKTYSDEAILGTGFYLRLYGAVVAYVLTITSAYFIDFKQDRLSFYIIAVLSFSFIFQSIDVIDLYLQSHLKSKVSVIIKNLSYLISSVFKIYLLINKYSVVYFAIALVLDLFLASIVLAVYTNKKSFINLAKWRWDGKIATSLLSTSWPLIISALSVVLYMRMDQIMIKNMLGSVEVGNYSAAVRITELFFILPVVITNSAFPILVKSRTNQAIYYNNLTKLYGTLIYISIFLSLSILIFSPFIISILYGEQYQSAASVLNIHVWSSLFVFVGVASSQQLVIEGQSKISLYRTLLGLGTNLILNIYLIPIYGVKGAAIATLLSYAVSSFFSNFLFTNTRVISKLYLKSLLIIKG